MMVGKPTDICIYLVCLSDLHGPIGVQCIIFDRHRARKLAKNDDQKRYGMTIFSMTLITPLGG
jgi:hypothetical protein